MAVPRRTGRDTYPGWARELKVEDFAPQGGFIRVMEEFDVDIFTRMRGHSL